MTALTARFSFIPLAIVNEPGKEILHLLAVVVLGRVLTSTLLDRVINQLYSSSSVIFADKKSLTSVKRER